MDRVDFVVVESKGVKETLACPKCGEMFDIDAYTNLNLVIDLEWKGVVAKCPSCGSKQEAS